MLLGCWLELQEFRNAMGLSHDAMGLSHDAVGLPHDAVGLLVCGMPINSEASKRCGLTHVKLFTLGIVAFTFHLKWPGAVHG
jgi:hypothetical protein